MNIESEVAKLVGLMAVAYPSAQMGKENIKVYVSIFKDIPLDILSASVQQCMAESDFLPSIAKVREKAFALSSPVAPAPLEAWGIVLKAIEKYGFYRTPVFENPIITRSVECMGWQTLCSSENPVADRAHFGKVYEGLLCQAENDRRMIPQARQIAESVRWLLPKRTMPDVPKSIGDAA